MVIGLPRRAGTHLAPLGRDGSSTVASSLSSLFLRASQEHEGTEKEYFMVRQKGTTQDARRPETCRAVPPALP